MPQERPDYDPFGGKREDDGSVSFDWNTAPSLLVRLTSSAEPVPTGEELNAWHLTAVDHVLDLTPGEIIYRSTWTSSTSRRLIVLDVDPERNRVRVWRKGKRCRWYDFASARFTSQPIQAFVRDRRILMPPPLVSGEVYRFDAADVQWTGAGLDVRHSVLYDAAAPDISEEEEVDV